MLRRLWTEELVTFDGEWHHLDRMGLNPMPVQRPIPIWMGAWFGKIVEKVLRRTGRLADGWMPQYPPGPELADAIARLRAYTMDAGRDPASISIACGIRVQRDEEPQKWVDLADKYRDLGATHLRVMTAGGGYETPREHLAAAIRWREAMG